MTNFTYNNHISYSIGGRQFGYRETPYEKYEVSVGAIDPDHYRKSNWRQEQFRIADMVYRDLGKDLVVMFSGGTDSEIVLRAFKHIGVTPRALFVEFTSGFNASELIAAREVTKSLGLPLEVVRVDVEKFYRSGAAQEIALSVQCASLAFLTIFDQIIKLQAPAVMGGTMTFYRRPTREGSEWFHSYAERDECSAMRLSLKHSIPVVHDWFMYTPECMGYFFEDPGIQAVLTTRYNFKTWTDSSKNEVIDKWFPGILKKKKTGYENLSALRTESDITIGQSLIQILDGGLDGLSLEALRKQLCLN